MLEGKQAASQRYQGQIVGLFDQQADLHTEAQLEQWTDLKLQLQLGQDSASLHEAYAKVTRVADSKQPFARLTFTSLSSEATAALRELQPSAVLEEASAQQPEAVAAPPPVEAAPVPQAEEVAFEDLSQIHAFLTDTTAELAGAEDDIRALANPSTRLNGINRLRIALRAVRKGRRPPAGTDRSASEVFWRYADADPA